MDFYKKLSEYYDDIFPLRTVKADFITSLIKKQSSLLDIGCGTGTLTAYLADQGYTVTGIDLDEEMIKNAVKNNSSKKGLLFLTVDMLRIRDKFADSSFNSVYCFGNTLAHLQGIGQIEEFISSVYKVLDTDGMLFIQILNFDYIINSGKSNFPVIQTENIKFERSYTFDDPSGFLKFKIKLTDKNNPDSKALLSETNHYPLKKEELNRILEKSGFQNIRYWSNFKRDPYLINSNGLIIEAQKL